MARTFGVRAFVVDASVQRYLGTGYCSQRMDRDDQRDRAPDALRRRSALVRILDRRAEPILTSIVSDSLRTADFAGLGRSVADRYVAKARAVLPACVAALGAPDQERERILADSARVVRDLVAEGVPPSVQRSFVGLGFKVASGMARDGARTQGFAPDELEDELIVFRRELEARFFAT